MNLTEDQAKKYLDEFRRFAAIASTSANAAIRAERNIGALAATAASAAVADRIGALAVVAGEPGSAPEWDAGGNTLTIPAGADGEDGTSVTITVFTDQALYDAHTPGALEIAVLTDG